MALRGVIFDMGGTLLYYSPPGKSWDIMEKIGAGGVYNVLREQNHTLVPEPEALDIAWDHAQWFWHTHLLEKKDFEALQLAEQVAQLAAKWGVKSVSPAEAESLARAYMAVIQAHVCPLDGAVDTLRTLRDQGLRVGLISNTVWPGWAHQQDLDRFGLTPYLEHQIFSADARAWKPYKEVFQLGLEALDLQADETIYVGDAQYFDVWGAQQAGLRGVWIEHTHSWLPDGIEVTPDATITTLPELFDVIKDWQ